MRHEWWHGWGPEGWGGMWFGHVIWLLLLGLAVAAFILLVRSLGNRDQRTTRPPPTPREILDDRFAKGEIDTDEYEERRRLLDK